MSRERLPNKNMGTTTQKPSVQREPQALVGSGRLVRPMPRYFEHFPETAKCPICHSSDDGPTVLIAIAGAARDGIAEAKSTHLACAICKQWDDGMQMGFTWPNATDQPRAERENE